MKFCITDISFDLTGEVIDLAEDCDCGEYIDTEMLQEQLHSAYTKTTWDADDHEDLLEQISDASGWCINSIQYTTT